jgi:DNA-binding transcriptional regulator YiaG
MISAWENNRGKPSEQSWGAFVSLETGAEAMQAPQSVEVPEYYYDSVKTLRVNRLGLSLSEFAKLFGVTASSVDDWERGRSAPSSEHWRKFLSLEQDAPVPVVVPDNYDRIVSGLRTRLGWSQATLATQGC